MTYDQAKQIIYGNKSTTFNELDKARKIMLIRNVQHKISQATLTAMQSARWFSWIDSRITSQNVG